MENAGDRFDSEFALDLRQASRSRSDDEMRHVVARFAMQRIFAVIAHIEQDQVVAIAQQIPERKVCVDRESVAVAEHEARAGGIAMAADADDRAVVHFEIENAIRLAATGQHRPSRFSVGHSRD